MRPSSAILVLGLIATGCEGRSGPLPTQASTQVVAERDEGASLEDGKGELPVLAPQDARKPAAESVTQGALAPDAASSSRTFGRTLDEQGEAIAGAEVWLASVGEPWSEHAPDASAMYRTTTDKEGRFEFITPVPTTTWISLVVTPSEFHAQSHRFFGEAGGRNRDPLRPGDNDLGDMILAGTGSLAGVVTDDAGQPVAGAQVTPVERLPGDVAQNATTDSAGAFVLGHLPETRVSVEVYAEGYLIGTSASVQVVAGERGGPLRIDLQAAPVVSGRIEDEEGRPVQGALVKGSPSSGRMASAVSGPDGSFVVRLPLAEPYRFRVKADGFVPIGEKGGDPAAVLQPNSLGVVLALRRSTRWTFSVVDDHTGMPIESFGLRVRPKPDGTFLASIDQEDIPVVPCPGGRITVDADSVKHLVQLQAPGYAPMSSEFGGEAAGSPTHELRLARGSTVTGIVRLRGVPVDSPSARLTPALIKLDPSLPDEEDTFFSDNYGSDLDRYTGRPRTVQGDSQGRIQLVDLAAGTYVLEVRARGAAPLEISPLRVEHTATVELGVIELPLGSTVRGRVLPVPGQTAAGTTVYLDDPFDEVSVVVKSDGVFEFTDLAASTYKLVVERVPGDPTSRVEVLFTVGEGETVLQDIDLSK
jgi:hypothetical protein